MNPPNTIARDTLVEAIAVAILNSDRIAGGWPPVESRDDIPDSAGYVRNAQAALTAITEAGMVICPHEPTEAMKEAGATAWRDALEDDWRSDAADVYRAMINAAAQAIEARSGETAGLDPQGESAVGVTDAPDHIMPPIRDSGPLESEEAE